LVLAQDSVKNRPPNPGGGDTTHAKQTARGEPNSRTRAGKKKTDYFRNVFKPERRKFDSSLFANVNVASTSDYATHLGKVYQMLSDIPGTLATFSRLQEIQHNLDSEDSVLSVVKERLSLGWRTFNVRNLQMYNTVLDALDKNTDKYSEYLDGCDSAMDDVRDQIDDFRKDTLMKHIFGDSALMNTFQSQLQQLKSKWREVDSLVTENGQQINSLTSYASAHSITIGALLGQVDQELKAMGTRAFQIEQPYLWQRAAYNSEISVNDLRDSFSNELHLAGFYFANAGNNRLLLPLIGILFFLWINYNFRRLTHLGQMGVVKDLNISYVNPKPLIASLIFILSLAPFFDIHGPAIYIEIVQFLIMVLLTIELRKRISPTLLIGWYIFILLFLVLSFGRIFGLISAVQRWTGMLVGLSSVILGVYFLLKQEVRANKWLSFTIGFFVFLNFLSIICNLLSRVTLSQIFANAAFFSLAQTIGLSIFVRLLTESFLLQVQTSRISKNYPPAFDRSFISTSIRRFGIYIAVILWLLVFTINLNLFDSISDLLTGLMTSVRKIGNFSFTIGGVLLFLGIIWLANFLQKYIAYFFGDTGEDTEIEDRGQRSRLMVTRLILLTAGFLLAVAASGLPVDRITVIFGALGIGVGLGLQNIVNNFVSGIILIFDRPLRIGDIVDIGDKRGRVKGIGIRASTLLTEEGAEVIIPNGEVLSHSIVNWTLSNSHARVALSFMIKKPENVEKVDPETIKKLIHENQNAIKQREPEILISPVNSKTSELKAFFWVNDFSKETITAGEVRSSIYKHLESRDLIAE
jgi:small-conductance mechanosensitive channel